MSMVGSPITRVSNVCSTVCSGADQGKHQSIALLASVRGIHRWPINSPQKGPVTRKMFPFDDVVMTQYQYMPLYFDDSSQWFDSLYLNKTANCMVVAEIQVFMLAFHDSVMTWKRFRYYWPFVGGTIGKQWLPRQRTSDTEFWCFADVSISKLLGKQSGCWWLRRHDTHEASL